MRCVPGQAFFVKRACHVYFGSRIFERSEIVQSRWIAKQNADTISKAFSVSAETVKKRTGRRHRYRFDSRLNISAVARAHAERRCEVSAVAEAARNTAEPTTESRAWKQHASDVVMESSDASDKVLEASGEDANHVPKDNSKKTKEDSSSDCSKEKEAPRTSSKIVDDEKAYKLGGSKPHPKTVDKIPFCVHVDRRARDKGRPVPACRLTCAQGEWTLREGGVGS